MSEIGHREGLQRRAEPRLNSERPKLLRNAPSEVGKEAANRNAATNTRRGAFTLALISEADNRTRDTTLSRTLRVDLNEHEARDKGGEANAHRADGHD